MRTLSLVQTVFFSLLILCITNCASPKATEQAPTPPQTTTYEEIEEFLQTVEVEADLEVENMEEAGAKRFHFYRDYEQVLDTVLQLKGDDYLDTLLARFDRRDISSEETTRLLVGATSLPGYRDQRLPALEARLDSLSTVKDLEALSALSDSILQIFPLNMKGLFGKFTVYSEREERNASNEYFGKMNRLFQASQLSGWIEEPLRPALMLSRSYIELYTGLYAFGAGYEQLGHKQDEYGNDVYKYQALGTPEYFIVPAKVRE